MLPRPAEFRLSLHALEAYIHGWDLAKALGRTFEPSAELTGQVAEIARQIVADDARGDFDGAPYGPAVSTGSSDPIDRLIAHTGRNPG